MLEGQGNREMAALRKVYDTLPQAFWEGIIEAGKTNPMAAFGLGFFRTLQNGLKNIPPEERRALANALLDTRLEDIETGLLEMGVEVGAQRQLIATILKALAKTTALIDGYAPVFGEVVACVARLESLPAEIREVLEDQLRRLDMRIGEIGAGVDRTERGMEEANRGIEFLIEAVGAAPGRGAEEEQTPETRIFELEYLKAVKEQYGELELLGIPSYEQRFPIDAAFVTLSLSDDGEAHRVLAASQMLSGHPRLVIEGEAGAGKTTLLQWEAVRQCEQAERIEEELRLSAASGAVGSGPNPSITLRKGGEYRLTGVDRLRDSARIIPFFIRLRSLIKREQDFNGFPDPGEWLALSVPYFQMHPPFENWLHSVLSGGRALVLFDGLDELPPIKREQFWRGLDGLLGQYKGLRFRVSSRYFPREEERAAQWAIPADPDTKEPVPLVKVEALTYAQIDRLIEKWHTAAVESEASDEQKVKTARDLDGYAEALKETLRKERYRRIRELAETPFLCAAICLINRHWKKQLPEQRHELYRLLVEALLSLREKMREISTLDPLYDSFSPATLINVHARLALDMMTSGRVTENDDVAGQKAGSYLIEAKREDVLKWLGEYIRILPELHGRTDAAALLDDFLVPRCGLLREPSRGSLDFRHRALQEYLAGTAAMQRGMIELLVSHAGDDRWRDTIILAAGGLNVGTQDAVRLIKSLLAEGEKKDLKVCYAIAVACLETARGLEMPVVEEALEKLDTLIPPRNSQEAKDLSAAGEAVVAKLPYEKALEDGDAETAAACAETLARIGSEAARGQLRAGYVDDPRESVVLRTLECPGIHPFDAALVTADFAAGRVLRVPKFAAPFLTHLRPLDRWPDIDSASLSDCPRLTKLSGIEHLRSLRRLSLARCTNVTSLEPLAQLRNLEILDLRGCVNLASLEPLAELPRLERVDLSHCATGLDVSPLGKLPASCAIEWLDRPAVERLAPLEPPANPEVGSVFYLPVGDTHIKFVWVPPDMFQMGSPDGDEQRFDDEGPVHTVQLQGFWIAVAPVTQTQYAAVMGTTPSDFQGEEHGDAPARPVESVSWEDAMAFCVKWGGQAQASGCRVVLPSEAQWEYACRAGSTARFCFGDSDAELGDYAWYAENSGDQTHPVGQKRPNAWGLHDMHGNVWEWCLDTWHENYEGAPTDGSAWADEDGTSRVFRGGSWSNVAGYCRSAYRHYSAPDYRSPSVGFRVLTVPSQSGSEG